MTSADGLADQLQLTPSEMETLHALRSQMMRADIEQERREPTREDKQRVTDTFHTEFVAAMKSAGYDVPSDFPSPDAAARLAGDVASRSRAMILLIDLMTFNPWFPEMKWVKDARTEVSTTVEN